MDHSLELLKYFKPCNKSSCDLLLPDPGGSLSKTVNRSAIEEASNKLTTVIADFLQHSSHSPCNDDYPAILMNMKFTDITVCFKPFYHFLQRLFAL